ncbi:MAG: HEAT repeat domain-containing protein [bacterium]|nr:HEAT repeat domain-containing protein [bacterium]
MKKLVLTGLCLAGLVALPDTVNAHGGQYRGPGDVVPPSPGGGRGGGGPSGPTTGGPSGPSAPGPSGPTTPGASGPSTGGPSGPSGGGAAQTGQRGIQLTDDLTRWEFWWEFNKDPFIRLREAVQAAGPQTGSDDFYLGGGRKSDAKDSLRPTEEQIMGEILPALKRSLDDTLERDFDIISSCMVAMAKIGKDHPDFKLYDVFSSRLKANNQEIRETAALSLGIAGITGLADKQMDLLAGLVKDDDLGRKTSEASQVNERTRSFAAYGLGLAAYSTTNLALKRKAFDALQSILTAKEKSARNMRVAAIHGLSLLNLDTDSEESTKLLDEAVEVLENYYMKKMGPGDQLIQSHCPTAIAKLIGKNHKRADHFKELFAKDLLRKGKIKRTSRDIWRSCALALGQLVRPNNDKDKKANPDVEYNKILLDSWHDSKDMQTRFFSMLALGQIGGELNRSTILKEFDKSKSLEKPWCALALGVYSFYKYEAQKAQSGEIEPEELIGETLYDEFRATKQPNLLASLAVAMGLNQYQEAADRMREKMLATVAQEDLSGYLCIGLALMNDTKSTTDIRRVVQESVRRPDLLKQAAIALGKLGDKRVADDLQKLMAEEGSGNLAKLSAIASALGFIGDQRSVAPVKAMLEDTSLGQLSRAFAAVALGGIADKELLPWNSKIAVNTNYRAAVETLTNRTSGILDIL